MMVHEIEVDRTIWQWLNTGEGRTLHVPRDASVGDWVVAISSFDRFYTSTHMALPITEVERYEDDAGMPLCRATLGDAQTWERTHAGWMRLEKGRRVPIQGIADTAGQGSSATQP